MFEASPPLAMIPKLDDLNRLFEPADPAGLLSWAADTFAPHIKLATSFGPEGIVLLDIITAKRLPVSVFYLDTGRLHQETYDLIDRARRRFGIKIEAVFPDARATAGLITLKGPNSFYNSSEDRHECCHIRKVEPLVGALRGAKAWITGRRRDQSVTRTTLDKIERDDAHGGILKLNPLADWSSEQVWARIRERDLPYNNLHDRGFPSIGCAPCTRAVRPGEHPRSGRWWWETDDHRECGIHLKERTHGSH